MPGGGFILHICYLYLFRYFWYLFRSILVVVVDARGSLPGCQAGDSFNCTLAYSIRHLLHVFVFLRVSTNTSHLSLYQFTIFLVDSFCKLIFPPFLKIHFSAHF